MTKVDPVPIAVVLTALDVEFQAIREHLRDVEIQTHPAGTDFYVGTLANGRAKVALTQVGQGNTGSAVFAERAISFLRPELLMFVGVAGRLMDDIELGDVVVPPRIYLLLSGMVDDDGFHPRPKVWHVSHALDQLARRVHRERQWLASLPDLPERLPEVYFRPVVAGDLVLNGSGNALAGEIRAHYNDAAAIEMESAGMAHAAALNQPLPSIAVRGISDTASGDKEATDRAGWQAHAARNAAAFAMTLLAEFSGGTGVDRDRDVKGRTRFDDLHAAIDELTAAEAAALRLREIVLAKIADPAVPSLTVRPPELRDWLAGLERLAGEDGRRAVPAAELEALAGAIAKAREEIALVCAAAQGALDRRLELRGRLNVVRAMATRLNLAEDEAGEAHYRRAYDLLWTQPCDLRVAFEMVGAYQGWVTHRREGPHQ